MTMTQVNKHFGTDYRLSQILAETSSPASPQAIGKWWRDGVPHLRQYQLQVLSAGKLKAEI